MTEGPPNQSEILRLKKEKIIALAVELSESKEVFPFPGIDREAYATIKASEEEDPGYVTLIDELIERFKNEGMRVVLGKYPASGNVFIVPAQSNNVIDDNLFPRHLQVNEGMDERLEELILLVKNIV
ncbi:MAG TPA: hypothetical protein VNF51_00570 [Candidatus Paceibacterota bacterium]|nr:hypothetical protein [Candidatus Paceibacterota bacterium]